MQLGTYKIDIQTNTAVGFDHEHHQWDPAYLYLDANSLMATGKGKLIPTGYTVRAKACTPDPEQMNGVAERFRELSGADLPIRLAEHWAEISGTEMYHIYEYEIGFHDRTDARRTKALSQAFSERWEPTP